ncbi:MAG: DUF424 family protein [Candidatus Aenigmarchaeota archaeon]|nr:DUF424 family protein [Candidatus Aenigmarchaeota archaeon]MDW8149533.1 DUF424 family protein [Candidatus Aenigmarchaeota archaeon]
MFWYRVHYFKYFIIVGICDEEILEKRIRFGDTEIYINPSFYKGSLIDEKAAIQVMKKCDVGNLFGNRIVELAIKNNIVDEKNILIIDGIKHAQFIK